MVDFCELNGVDFEKSIMKNTFIRSTKGEWIWFIDAMVTSRKDIEPIIQENDFLLEYDAVVFGSEELEGEIGLYDLLAKPEYRIYAFGVKRQLLIKTGAFNQVLQDCSNYEFLVRVANQGIIFAVSCVAEKSEIFSAVTMAYVIRRYMLKLADADMLDAVVLHVMKLAQQHGKEVLFNKTMRSFGQDEREYESILEDTAPCLVLIGSDICAGILAGFANSLADELVALGQAVITTDSRYGDYKNIPTTQLLTQNYKAIIGFQTPAFIEEIIPRMKGKKIHFWFDNPIFFNEFWDKHTKDMYILCQDANYANYIREYWGICNSIQFPPGGTVIKNLPSEKIYDITFVGNYEPLPDCEYEEDFEKGFFEYMITHPDTTFENGILEYGRSLGMEYNRGEVVQLLQRLGKVCRDILDRERHYVIEKIVGSGIKLHVFSERWEMYKGEGRENLIIHPMIYGEEPYRVWAQSKIGLSIMRGHKSGMTERIANIMLCGTCCLSDETVYLREHFTDGRDIVLFKRTELDELPKKIKYLLEHDEEREHIAILGYKKAMEEHTWRRRAEQLMEILY